MMQGFGMSLCTDGGGAGAHGRHGTSLATHLQSTLSRCDIGTYGEQVFQVMAIRSVQPDIQAKTAAVSIVDFVFVLIVCPVKIFQI